MKIFIKQAIYIIVCSWVIGIGFNYFRPHGIPFIAKQIDRFNDNPQMYEFIIEIIDIEIAKKFFNDDVIFVDARDDIYFSEGHITGAIQSNLYDELVNTIIDNNGFNEPIVVYCDDAECGLSEDLAYRLQAEGFSKIYIFSGGWNQWFTAKLPIEK